MGNPNLDISIRGNRSIVRVLDNEIKSVSESTIMTRDLFESISRLSAPSISQKKTWFNVLGDDYTALRYLAEYPDIIDVLVERTPARVPFRARLWVGNHSLDEFWSQEQIELLGIKVFDNSNKGIEIDTLIDVPYMVMAMSFRRNEEGFYQHIDSSPFFANDSINSCDSKLYGVKFPNIHYNGAFNGICWGTAIDDMHSIDLSGIVQFPGMFFDAIFNLDLCNLDWYANVLPKIARHKDELFRPFCDSNDDNSLDSALRIHQTSVENVLSHLIGRRR
jgi:hypothetical protein